MCPQITRSMTPKPDIGPPSGSAVASINKIENIIGKDEGGRGMESLIVPGDLLQGATRLARLSPRSLSRQARVLILSGFPCCVDESPPTETDGPPGSAAIARAAVGLGHHATIITDECNREVFAAALQSLWESCLTAAANVELVTYPSEDKMSEEEWKHLEGLTESTDLIVACERAGPAKDGRCYTMRGIDMTGRGLIAPIHKVVELARRNKVAFVAIGDGGNELGMGKVLDEIIANPKIANADKIAAVMPADDLIAASVSNWGGYALAAAALVVHNSDRKRGRLGIDSCVPTEEEEIKLLRKCVMAGCRDGVSGKMESTVDGMPLETSMKCLRRIRAAALEAEC